MEGTFVSQLCVPCQAKSGLTEVLARLALARLLSPASMRILIMGSGGVGAYYGGLLARAGHEVTFVARGAHLQALQQQGLTVKSVHGDFVLNPVRATADPATAGPVDLILFCVKTYDTEPAAQAIRPAVGPHTLVLSLQNGIDAAERIGAVVGSEHVIGGATWISSVIAAPGVIRQASQFRRIVLGPLDGPITPAIEAVYQALCQTGVTVELSAEMPKVLWTKFVFIAGVSGIGSLTRLTMGEYRHVPETRRLIEGLMREVKAVAEGQGVAMDADVVERSLAFMDGAAPGIKPSMQLDIEAGRRFELESMIGAIWRKGREVGIPTPIAEMVYAALLPIQLKAEQAYAGR